MNKEKVTMPNDGITRLSSAEVKQRARDCRIDLVGIASIDRFQGVAPDAHPASILPHAQSVIVLGHRIPRGSLRGPECGKAFHTLATNSPMSYAITKTYQFCCSLETAGWEAVPLYPHTRDVRNQGVPVAPGRQAPDVVLDVEYAAHAAGLGEMGRGQFFLTPEFGPRQYFTFVVTDLPLVADTPIRGICDNCGACAAACPAGALATDRLVETADCAGVSSCYALRLEHCRVCPMTANLTPPYATTKEPWRLAAGCARACVAHLEDGNKLTRAFHAPFRREATPC
jgi:epoxyqueuosine reductase QueG